MSKNIDMIPILVVSSSPYMRGIIKFVLETLLRVDVTELDSEEKALNFLKNLEHQPGMIVYDYTPNAYLLEDFVGYLKANSKLVRIVVLVEEIREEGKELIQEFHQLKLMERAKLPGNLIEEATRIFNEPAYINDDPYCRIDIDFLCKLDGINKNLFIKIGSDKFIRVFSEDDNTNILDIKKYKEKGIQYLFVNRETAMWVTNQIQKQINIFLKANNFRFVLRGASESPKKRFEQKILRIDEEVHIESDFKEAIDKAIENIKAIVEKEQKVEHFLKLIQQNKNDLAFFTQKMNLTSVMSCLLAKQLDWISKTTMDKLVYASVICDLTLAVRPELLRIQGMAEFERVKSSLSEEDQKIFLSHPKDAAYLIKKYFTLAPTDTSVLAYEHHETPDGTGFPLHLRADKISPLSALFIVANDFASYFLTDDEPNMDDFILKCHSRYDFVNFRRIVKALERLKK